MAHFSLKNYEKKTGFYKTYETISNKIMKIKVLVTVQFF